MNVDRVLLGCDRGHGAGLYVHDLGYHAILDEATG
ncbi:hypothetical protein HEB94_000244 [Actinopolymorpha pittospori]|uniref:Uncharacterized protein n=1 Tax=Actinopolymorpha pittospori TaxID=648752 RepID=A0A927MMH5_9ACTN|nr:hypothetical protein [Actinopolymorpha pittospori]